jgi:hypothetical protein
MTKQSKVVEIGVEEGVRLGSGIKDSLLSNLVLKQATLTLFNVV